MGKGNSARSGARSWGKVWRRTAGPHRRTRGSWAVPELLERRELLAADFLINEVLAANESVWMDDLGQHSDFIEIYNPDAQAQSLSGWGLTDDLADLQKWQFPDVQVASGGYLVVAASGEDRRDPQRPLHLNFQIAAAGEPLALVRPDGSIAQVFDPLLPQYDDVAYGRGQGVTSLIDSDSMHRYRVPSAADTALGSTWMLPGTDVSSWESGQFGLGYGLFETGYSVRFVDVTGGLDGQISTSGEAEWFLGGNAPPGRYEVSVDVNATYNVLDFGNANGTFNVNNDYPAFNDGDDLILEARAIVTIPEGDWTIGFGSDDGGFVRLDDVNFFGEFNTNGDTAGDNVLRYNTLRGHDWTTGQITVGPGGVTTNLTALMFQRTGEDALEVAIRPGHYQGQVTTANWQLLKNGTFGWRVARPDGSEVRTNVEQQVKGVNSSVWVRSEFELGGADQVGQLLLDLQYDDGVVIYVNGTEVARRNAPANPAWNATALSSRSPDDAFSIETINLAGGIGSLVDGTNVLGIQLLNAAVDDATLVLIPRLRVVGDSDQYGYLLNPTPGRPNGDDLTDFAAAPTFSVPRGFYDAPFLLELATSTPGSTIRVTLDGSEPTLTNGLPYQAPIRIGQTSVVRAATFKSGSVTSPSVTHTYLFLADVLRQSTPPTGFPFGSVNGQVFDYGMDPDIVNSAVWGPQLIEALTQIPSISMSTDTDNLFSSQSGIYTHAGSRGRAWERPASVELIDPNGGGEFQINAGVRIRGGFSRSGSNPKHAFRLFFRKDYGDGKLDFPLFGDEGATEFDNIDLRTTQNYSWAFQGDSRNTFLRDIFSREVQGELGNPYTRGRYYHLYINGVYWGLYQTDERAEASFAETYLGGAKEDYDVVKNGGGSGIEATDGDLQAYRRLWEATNIGYSSNVAYYRIQGMNTDGTRNPNYERLLDVNNLIDYMIITYFTGDKDGPGSRFTQPRPNNFVGIYNRVNPDGFKWIEHDSEHSLDTGERDMVNPLTLNHSGFNSNNFQFFNPHWLHERLVANPEYRQRFADRVQMALFGDGPLSVDKALERIDARAADMEMAIIAESARWGDSRQSSPFTKVHWQNAVQTIRNYLRARTPVVISQFVQRGWFPNTEAAVVLVNGVPTTGTSLSSEDRVSFGGSDSFTTWQLVAPNRPWQYLDDGSNQGTAWRELQFNDSSWNRGSAELGYGDGDETTVISYGNDSANKITTTYFRRGFTLDESVKVSSLLLRLKRDDGAIVYINGTEVARTNLPGGAVTYQTTALSAVGGADESTFFEFVIDNPSMLRVGTNMVAVELHQVSGTSSDVSFDLELLGLVPTQTGDDVYYTLDGSDPRQIGGRISPAAIAYDGKPFSLAGSAAVAARVFKNNEWSPIVQTQLRVDPPPVAGELTVTEIHYNPAAADVDAGEPDLDNNEFEFLELMNTTAASLDITGLRIVDGVTFTFPFRTLEAGERVLVVKNENAFLARYPQVDPDRIAGVYTGSLSNGGETIELVSASGQSLLQLTYDDSGNWPGRADGNGSSLERMDLAGDANNASSWASSVAYGGTPGEAPVPFTPRLVINEVLPHTDAPQLDTVELVNVSNLPVNLAGWYLSDTAGQLKKYRFGDVTVEPGAYLVLTEADFNPGEGTLPNDFALSSVADDLWLVSADPTTRRLLEFVDHVEFDGTFNGMSLGRIPSGQINASLFPLAVPSFGQANGPHRVGELVITEVNYNPPGDDTGREYIELHNTTGTPLDVSGWRISGADYLVPSGTMVPAGGTVLLVSFDPHDTTQRDAFLLEFPTATGAVFWGPWELGDSLDNGGETISVFRPDEPPDGTDIIPYVLIDQVQYDDNDPWPVEPDGEGQTLARTSLVAFPLAPSSWVAESPSPGFFGDGLPGDVNHDNKVNAVDLTLIARQAFIGTYVKLFDVNQDNLVTLADRDYVATELLGTTPGDLDLDGDVDSVDLGEFLAGWTGVQTPGEGDSGWDSGDIDGDFDTDSNDLGLLIGYWTGAQNAIGRQRVAGAVDAVFDQS